MRIAIVEDESSQRQLIAQYLGEWRRRDEPKPESVCFQNSESFLFSWEEDKQFDLLILDIEMGDINGMELARKLRSEGEQIPILFVTGYQEYMQYGYDVGALHYLMKPLQKQKLFQVLERLALEQEKEEKKLLVDTVDGKMSISLDKIWYVEASAHRSQLFLEHAQITLKNSFGEIEEWMRGRSEFVKCHRSYLINLKHVSSLGKTDVFLDDGRNVPLSRLAAKQVGAAFIRYYASDRE